MSEFVIQYDYRGTVHKRAGVEFDPPVVVGKVYVTGPHFGGSIYSHTYKAERAARFTEAAAMRLLVAKGWGRNGGIVWPAGEAEDLPDPFTVSEPTHG